jgi:hypothetical protein
MPAAVAHLLLTIEQLGVPRLVRVGLYEGLPESVRTDERTRLSEASVEAASLRLHRIQVTVLLPHRLTLESSSLPPVNFSTGLPSCLSFETRTP